MLLKDESQHDDMMSILETLQEYSPQIEVHAADDCGGTSDGDCSTNDVHVSDSGTSGKDNVDIMDSSSQAAAEEDKNDSTCSTSSRDGEDQGTGTGGNASRNNSSCNGAADVIVSQEAGPQGYDKSGKDVYVQGILLGGDQLSTSMARRVIADRINSMNDKQCLKGIVPVVEDWHTKLCFLTVSNI